MLRLTRLGSSAFAFATLLACSSSNTSDSGAGAGAAATNGGSNGAAGSSSAARGGTTSSGGSSAAGATNGGATNAGATSAGTTSRGGTSAGGASAGGTTSSGGKSTASGGSAGAAPGAGGSAGASTNSGGSTSTNCGSSVHNEHPLGCNFGWGIASPGGSLTNYSYVQLMSQWVGTEVKADGSITSCTACTWLSNQVSKTNIVPAFYAYFIGYYGHANGLPDGNQTSGQSLTTGGAALIKANRSKIIQMYTWYAQQVYKVWSTKPLIWLLEGDFVQYTGTSQSSPLSYADLGALAADISCAIKSNMPNAVVAIDHSSWNADDVTNSYWAAMANVNYDMVWTTGVGNNKGFIQSSTTSTTYNHTTGTYAYLHNLTGRTILVDTSAGASSAGDSWSTASVTDLNGRIADGVIAANITGTAPTNLQSNISALSGLNTLPACP